VTEDLNEALEQDDGLAWASTGLWTDVAIRSAPAVLAHTINDLKRTVDDEQATNRRSLYGVRQLTAIIVSSGLIVAIVVALIEIQNPTARSGLAALISILVGTLGFLVGMASAARVEERRNRSSLAFRRQILQRELEYQQRIMRSDNAQ
jgi:xanthosine utilization system XapX-like protein